MKLKLNFYSNVSEPGEPVHLNISTEPNSQVSLCIIDKSVELLDNPKELTTEKIGNYVSSIKLKPYYPQTDNLYAKRPFEPFPFRMDSILIKPGYWDRPKELKILNVKIHITAK